MFDTGVQKLYSAYISVARTGSLITTKDNGITIVGVCMCMGGRNQHFLKSRNLLPII